MSRRYEYKFVRLGEQKGWLWRGHLPVHPSAVESYQDIVHERAAEGWRLVQILMPGTMMNRYTAYYELIFEREVQDAQLATTEQQAETSDQWHVTEGAASFRLVR